MYYFFNQKFYFIFVWNNSHFIQKSFFFFLYSGLQLSELTGWSDISVEMLRLDHAQKILMHRNDISVRALFRDRTVIIFTHTIQFCAFWTHWYVRFCVFVVRNIRGLWFTSQEKLKSLEKHVWPYPSPPSGHVTWATAVCKRVLWDVDGNIPQTDSHHPGCSFSPHQSQKTFKKDKLALSTPTSPALHDRWGGIYEQYSHKSVIKLKTRQRLAVYYISQGSVFAHQHPPQNKHIISTPDDMDDAV